MTHAWQKHPPLSSPSPTPPRLTFACVTRTACLFFSLEKRSPLHSDVGSVWLFLPLFIRGCPSPVCVCVFLRGAFFCAAPQHKGAKVPPMVAKMAAEPRVLLFSRNHPLCPSSSRQQMEEAIKHHLFLQVDLVPRGGKGRERRKRRGAARLTNSEGPKLNGNGSTPPFMDGAQGRQEHKSKRMPRFFFKKRAKSSCFPHSLSA